MRTKATLIYRRKMNLHGVQLLLSHTKLDSTIRYLDIKVDDSYEMLNKLNPEGSKELPLSMEFALP
jgi:hypothetical protein